MTPDEMEFWRQRQHEHQRKLMKMLNAKMLRGIIVASVKDPNILSLTPEDCVFLWEMKIQVNDPVTESRTAIVTPLTPGIGLMDFWKEEW